MTEQELNEIEARANAATEGPWDRRKPFDWQDTAIAGGNTWAVFASDSFPRSNPMLPADANFIAAARSDVPALAAEARRLRAGIASLRKEMGHGHWSDEGRKAFALALKWLGEEEPMT